MLSNQQMLSSRTRARTTPYLIRYIVQLVTKHSSFHSSASPRRSNRQNKPKYTHAGLNWIGVSEANGMTNLNP